MTQVMTWARLWPAAKLSDTRLRQGAWYPVTGTHGNGRLELSVARRPLIVPTQFFEIAGDVPQRFTIVQRRLSEPNPAKGTPANLGCAYGVCPMCTARVRLFGKPNRLQCEVCGHSGGVDWSAAE